VVGIVTAAEAVPGAMVTNAGGDASADEELMAMETPPAGAAPSSVIVAVTLFPPLTVSGERVREYRAGGFTVTVTVLVTPRLEAVMIEEARTA
jgi:hypothetical protein